MKEVMQINLLMQEEQQDGLFSIMQKWQEGKERILQCRCNLLHRLPLLFPRNLALKNPQGLPVHPMEVFRSHTIPERGRLPSRRVRMNTALHNPNPIRQILSSRSSH